MVYRTSPTQVPLERLRHDMPFGAVYHVYPEGLEHRRAGPTADSAGLRRMPHRAQKAPI